MVSQLSKVSSDGTSPNMQFDCVPSSIGAAILWYEGKSQWDQDMNPDKLLDMAYPEGYQGGTSAANFVKACQGLGYKLYSINGLVGQLPELAHQYLAKNVPVIFTERDPYVPASYGWTHVCVWYADSSGQLTALDPYVGKPVTRTDQEWVSELVGNELWIVEKIQEEEMVTIDISNPIVATYYKALNDQQWQCIQTSKIIQYGILAAYKGWGNSALCGLTYLGLPKSNEIPVDAVKYPGVVIVFFERGVVCWDPGHILDNPPGAGSVYAAHLYSGPGRDPELLAQIKQLQAQLAAQPAQNPAMVNDMQQIKTIAGKY